MGSTDFDIQPIGTGTLCMRATGRTFEQVLRQWQEEEAFRAAFMEPLREAPFEAYRWELPALDRARLGQPFECVLVDSPELLDRADAQTFARYFSASESIVTFDNLGGDAHLIVPSPRASLDHYAHLAAFLRGAPSDQCQELWKVIGAVTTTRVSDRPLWLSTAGGGVAWLHVRLDERPKYYHHLPYRRATSEGAPSGHLAPPERRA